MISLSILHVDCRLAFPKLAQNPQTGSIRTTGLFPFERKLCGGLVFFFFFSVHLYEYLGYPKGPIIWDQHFVNGSFKLRDPNIDTEITES